jgi:hypothetical protein
MGSNSSTWNCAAARDDVLLVSSTLAEKKVIHPWVKVDDVEDIFESCDPCQANRQKKCLGWRLAFRERRALVFPSVDVKGRKVNVELGGKFCARRKTAGSWEQRPLSECSGAISVLDPARNLILSRIHIDLATTTAQEHEPVWHIQAGGLPGPGHEKPETRWLTVPRLPSQPMDFPLLVELVLYNFMPGIWSDLAMNSAWRRMLKRSEALVLPHYFEHWRKYWSMHNNEKDSSSWLAHQSNQYGKWKPWAV